MRLERPTLAVINFTVDMRLAFTKIEVVRERLSPWITTKGRGEPNVGFVPHDVEIGATF